MNLGGGSMRISYNKLWKLLIDKKMNRVDLRRAAHISTTSLAKLGKDENVSMTVLKKICKALLCNIGDIMDILPEDGECTKPFPCETRGCSVSASTSLFTLSTDKSESK